jgi:hypothetical protein
MPVDPLLALLQAYRHPVDWFKEEDMQARNGLNTGGSSICAASVSLYLRAAVPLPATR